MVNKGGTETHMKFIKLYLWVVLFFTLNINFLLTLRKWLNNDLQCNSWEIEKGMEFVRCLNLFSFQCVRMYVTNEHLGAREKSVKDSAFHKSPSKMLWK